MTFSTSLRATLIAFVSIAVAASASDVSARAADPCAAIGGKKWVSPKEVRACYSSFKVDSAKKTNVRTPSLSSEIRILTSILCYHRFLTSQKRLRPSIRLSITSLGHLSRLHRTFTRTFSKTLQEFVVPTMHQNTTFTSISPEVSRGWTTDTVLGSITAM